MRLIRTRKPEGSGKDSKAPVWTLYLRQARSWEPEVWAPGGALFSELQFPADLGLQ